MRDARVEKVADIIVDYSLEIRRGELVSIRGPAAAEPLIHALYERILKRGAHPVVRTHLPSLEPLFYRFAEEHQLRHVWEPDLWYGENIDVDISILAATNTRRLSKVDPDSQVMVSQARRRLLETRMRRGAEGSLRWNVTLFPTEAHAMESHMSLDEYEDFFYGACLVGADDPVAEWKKMAAHHAKMIEWMRGRSEVHIEGEGTDITLDVGDRVFIPADGKSNFPDGEIFTAPHEDKTSGVITFTYPAIYGGQVVDGVRLEFEAGKVVDASARLNEDFLIKTLDTDPGARILGELGIGTNFGVTDFSGEILLDEKIGGTVHLAVGAAYPECGGTNESAVHWDMVCDLRRGGRITVDGDTLLEDGRLLV